MLSFLRDLVVSMFCGFLGQFVTGAFVLIAAWYAFKTENKKALIIKKHEIAINQLIPNVYSPLLNLLNEHLEKERLGRRTNLDPGKVLEIFEKNICLLFFLPEDIQKILQEISKICYSFNTPDLDNKVAEDLLINVLCKLRLQIEQKFAQYILRG